MIKFILHYLAFLLKASNVRKTKRTNPIIFEAISPHSYFDNFKNIEKQRKLLLKNDQLLKITDYGTGSRVNNDKLRPIANIAKYSLKPPKQAQILFRLIRYFACKNNLEIGTSLGITSCYLAMANKKSKLFTLEGCSEQLEVAEKIFKNLNISNIKTVQGSFSETLACVLKEIKTLDFVFFDGNHSFSATQKYYENCLLFAHKKSIFVFDDIYLNKGMRDFWKQFVVRKEITLSVDLFHFGIVFFNPSFTKKNILIRI